MPTGAACTTGNSKTKMARQFFIPTDAIQDDRVALPSDLASHIGAVLRLTAGEEIILLDGNGQHYRCIIDRLDKRSGEGHIIDQWQETEQTIPVELLQGVPKGDKMDLILQKGTELGIRRFSPVWSERSIPSPDTGRNNKKQLRWQRIVSEAARQSRRPILPQCELPRRLEAALIDCRAELKLMLWEEGSRPLKSVLPQYPPQDVAILVGPEGGFSAREADLAQSFGFIPVHLGPRILRTESAGFAVSAVLQYLYGDFGVAAPTRAPS